MKLTARIEPTCVRPGGSATVHVATVPYAGVGYNTYYSNGETGAAHPFGHGLGGNAGGLADPKGNYSSTWVVSPKAPPGPAYAIVGAAASHGRQAETKVAFDVAASC